MVDAPVIRAPRDGHALPGGVSVETIRGIAVLLLVSFHVIGQTSDNGLGVSGGDPLRIYADLLIDIRMPLFAFIAGWVYGLKPVTVPVWPAFVLGKTRRLIVPGLVAALLFATVSNLTGTGAPLPWAELWRPAVLPYVHFWFLQAIFAIFVVFGALDALLNGRWTVAVLILAIALYMVDFRVTRTFSVNHALFLLPYFLLGLASLRHLDTLLAHRGLVLALAGAGIAIGLAAHAWSFHETGHVLRGRPGATGMALGFGACLIGLLFLPRVAVLERIGPYAFTIYLYHIFGTSGTRQALDMAGVGSDWIKLALGTLAGVALPIMLHLVAERLSLTRRLVLGMRR